MTRRAKPTRKPRAAPSNDRMLIRQCITYAQAIAAFEAGFKVDPDGSKSNAASLGRQSARADAALAIIAATQALTAEGLQSKASILPMVIDSSPGSMEEGDEAFYRSFAADVQAFLDPIIREHRVARNDGARVALPAA